MLLSTDDKQATFGQSAHYSAPRRSDEDNRPLEPRRMLPRVTRLKHAASLSFTSSGCFPRCLGESHEENSLRLFVPDVTKACLSRCFRIFVLFYTFSDRKRKKKGVRTRPPSKVFRSGSQAEQLLGCLEAAETGRHVASLSVIAR